MLLGSLPKTDYCFKESACKGDLTPRRCWSSEIVTPKGSRDGSPMDRPLCTQGSTEELEKQDTDQEARPNGWLFIKTRDQF